MSVKDATTEEWDPEDDDPDTQETDVGDEEAEMVEDGKKESDTHGPGLACGAEKEAETATNSPQRYECCGGAGTCSCYSDVPVPCGLCGKAGADEEASRVETQPIEAEDGSK